MLLDYSKKNIAILALAQAAIVLLGIAACGAAGHLRQGNWEGARFTYRVLHWGWVGLIIPIAWLVLAVWFFHWSKRPVLAEAVVPISGLVIAFLLALFMLHAFVAGVVQPPVVQITTCSPQ